MKALSIRQPWAWLIVNGHKDIENRTWPTKFRGDFLIHAAGSMTKRELFEAQLCALSIAPIVIPENELLFGGVIGRATIVDCVKQSDSPWFTGPWGHVIAGAYEVPFQKIKGQLGYFEVPE